MDSFNLTMDDH